MPTYQYRCTQCGHDLEAVQKFTDPALTECPSCSGQLRKVFNAVGVVFKGSGFYRNDSRAKEGAGSGSRSDATKDAGGQDSGGSKDSGGGKDSGGSKDSGGGKESGGGRDSGKNGKGSGGDGAAGKEPKAAATSGSSSSSAKGSGGTGSSTGSSSSS